MNGWMVTLGVAVFGYALRTFASAPARKAGAALYLTASWLAGWLLTGSHFGGAAAVAVWFLLPWVEILLRVRKMRLPLRKTLKHRFAPSRDDFPHLPDLTEEVEKAGFEKTDDTGFDWEEVRQFIRVFYHAPSRTQAAIHLNEQGNMSVVFVTVTTRTEKGVTLTTSNYPFSQTMRSAPGHLLQREPSVESFDDLLAGHRSMLHSLAVDEKDIIDPGPDGLAPLLEADVRKQVDHNLRAGLIMESGEGTFRYSWRGCFFLWGQFVKDMVKFA